MEVGEPSWRYAKASTSGGGQYQAPPVDSVARALERVCHRPVLEVGVPPDHGGAGLGNQHPGNLGEYFVHVPVTAVFGQHAEVADHGILRVLRRDAETNDLAAGVWATRHQARWPSILSRYMRTSCRA